MTRPQIIRADTIDLQDPKAPSAKDHSRQPHRPSPLGGGPSPHQADALRHAEKEAASAQQRSPRVSWVEGDGFAPDGQAILVRQDHDQDPDQDDDGRAGAFDDDATTIADDGTSDSPPDDMTLVDGDDDDGLDDDLLQNMSSSPSIDDGGYHTSSSRLPARTDPLRRRPNSSSPSSPPPSSSSPLSTPNRLGFSPSILSRSRRPPSYQHQMEGEVEEGMVHHRHRHRHRRRGDSRGGRGGIDDRSDGTRPGAASPIHRRAIRCQFDGSQESHRTDPHDDSLDGLGPAGEDSLLDRGLDQLASDSHDREYGSGGIEIDNAPGLDRDDDDDDDDDDGFGVDDDDDDDDDDDHIYTFDLDNDTDGTDDVFFSDDPRFIDYGWGAKCLHVAEDIDFEFVYALRSFTATVEGQANASKGETMVLLDDTNSYWWLVRVVKDSSIGYLPAEDIETPTERLARLNKHRNIDLSATMLGDNAERPMNPLKKAMRRRNAKTVQFSDPTYYEVSDVDYSTDDEADDDDGVDDVGADAEADDVQRHARDDRDEITAVESLRSDDRTAPNTGNEAHERVATGNAADANKEARARSSSDSADTSKDETGDRNAESINKHRHGFVRNTDSFFKDDNIETRKITLTPNLLRDDSGSVTPRSSESRDQVQLRTKGSLELFERSGPGDKSKDDKKKREKKPGMLSGLFRRKDRKSKPADDDTEEGSYGEKQSVESMRASPVSEGSEEPSRAEVQRVGPPSTKEAPNKLQKKSRGDAAPSREGPVRSATGSREPSPRQIQGADRATPPASTGASPARPVEEDASRQGARGRSESIRKLSPEAADQEAQPPQQQPRGVLKGAVREQTNAPAAEVTAGPRPGSPEPRHETIRAVDPRTAIEDGGPMPSRALRQASASPERLRQRGDSGDDDVRARATPPPPPTRPVPVAATGRPSESPVRMSRQREGAADSPAPTSIDSFSGVTEERPSTPSTATATPPAAASSTSSTSSNVARGGQAHAAPTASNATDDELERRQTPSPSTTNTTATTTTNTTTTNGTSSTPTWSDSSLRSYLDSDNDIRDLLIVVHDKSGVLPAGPEHPVVGALFREENARLADMTNRLDSLLGDWLASKTKAPAQRHVT